MMITLGKADVTLRDWNILQFTFSDGTTSEHFIGYSQHDNLGRLSTKIKEYDIETSQGATESGSVYTTVGPPGRPHDDAIYVLEQQIGGALVQRELFSQESKGLVRYKYPI